MYLVYCIIAVCVVVLWSWSLYLGWIVSVDAGCAGNRRKLIFRERFDAKYLHQVIFISAWCVCSFYCCLSGTTCVPVIIQSITTLPLPACLPHITCILVSLHYCYCCCVLGILYQSCVCRGSVIIELVSRMKSTWMLGVPEIEEKLFFRERFDAKYLHQVSYLLDTCVHHTAVYPAQRVCLS